MDITRYVEKYRDEKEWLYRMRGPDRAKKNCPSYRGDVKGGRPGRGDGNNKYYVRSANSEHGAICYRPYWSM